MSLTVRAGKGRKDRITYVERGAADAIADWLYFRDEVPGPLFTRIDKGDRLTHARLTPQAVYYILGVRCEEADVDPLSPHDFRRTFVSDLLDAGVDLATVSRPVLSLPKGWPATSRWKRPNATTGAVRRRSARRSKGCTCRIAGGISNEGCNRKPAAGWCCRPAYLPAARQRRSERAKVKLYRRLVCQPLR